MVTYYEPTGKVVLTDAYGNEVTLFGVSSILFREEAWDDEVFDDVIMTMLKTFTLDIHFDRAEILSLLSGLPVFKDRFLPHEETPIYDALHEKYFWEDELDF